MKNWLSIILFIPLLSWGTSAEFDHSGVAKGGISETCYYNPCSVAKVVSFRQLQQSPGQSMIELSLLGGSKDWDSEAVEWNDGTHEVYITCSKRSPTIAMDGQSEVLPLAPDAMIPGVLVSSVELYLKACHNFSGSADEAIQRFGYQAEMDGSF